LAKSLNCEVLVTVRMSPECNSSKQVQFVDCTKINKKVIFKTSVYSLQNCWWYGFFATTDHSRFSCSSVSNWWSVLNLLYWNICFWKWNYWRFENKCHSGGW